MPQSFAADHAFPFAALPGQALSARPGWPRGGHGLALLELAASDASPHILVRRATPCRCGGALSTPGKH